MAGLNYRRKQGTGRMNQKISFYSLAGTSDGQGGTTIESETLIASNVWAEIKEMNGQKKILFNQLHDGKPFEIRIRQRSDISESSVIGIDSRRLIIHSINTDNEYKGQQYIVALEK